MPPTDKINRNNVGCTCCNVLRQRKVSTPKAISVPAKNPAAEMGGKEDRVNCLGISQRFGDLVESGCIHQILHHADVEV